MTSSSTHVDAFAVIIKKCLSLRRGDQLLVVHDESFFPYCRELLQATVEASVVPTFLFIPKQLQTTLVSELGNGEDAVGLSISLTAAFRVSQGILNVLSGDPATAKVRGAVVNLARPMGCRLAHIPGLDEMILDVMGGTQVDELVTAGEALGWALGEARTATITTYSVTGQDFTLSVPLGGWDNEPFLSTGVIPAGSWGNVPPAETFILPLQFQAEGQILLSGSVTGHVIKPGEEVILIFQKGRLVNWLGDNGSPVLKFFEKERERGEAAADKNWNALAELGIGLNPAIVELTGNPLFDEKVARTVHVAIGDNFHFGGPIRSNVHHDLVTWKPDIDLDGNRVVIAGEIDYDALAASKQRSLQDAKFEGFQLVTPRTSRAVIEDRRLRRRLSRANRHGTLPITDEDWGFALADIWQELSVLPDGFDAKDFLRKHPEFMGVRSDHLLAVLYHIRAIDAIL